MTNRKQGSRAAHALTVIRMTLLALVLFMLTLTVVLIKSAFHRHEEPESHTALAAPVILPSRTPVSLPIELATAPPVSVSNDPLQTAVVQTVAEDSPAGNGMVNGVAFLSIMEGGYSHLFAFSIENGTFTRITYGEWDDITPAVSPDGSRLAFASNRSGVWDLYLLDLDGGSVVALTSDPEYESNPSWSPDGLWIAYDTYQPDKDGGNLEIFIRPVDGSQPPIQLTSDPAADYSPAWSPQGRKLAFISSRSGCLEVWLADLDRAEDMFTNLSREPGQMAAHPVWSPDGGKLAWSSSSEAGVAEIRIWDGSRPNDRAAVLESGSWPTWAADGKVVLSAYETPNQTYLTGYRVSDHAAVLPLASLSGELDGIAWGEAPLSQKFLDGVSEAVHASPAPLWEMGGDDGENGIRSSIAPLDGVKAPVAMLHKQAGVAFQALRKRVAAQAGWDFLAVLDQAYAPLTTQLEPGFLEDWLYTGRAFQFNSAPMQAGWLVLVKEGFGADTYWRVFIRTRRQDGSQGRPMKGLPFDVTARFSGEPRAYEQGGRLGDKAPVGYWIDFTRLAGIFGWERLPSLSTWRISFSGIRCNEYVLREGQDWLQAMLQVYPRAALNTPTPVSSPTMTLTPTATATYTSTATRTPYLSPTASATLSRWPTATPSPAPVNH